MVMNLYLVAAGRSLAGALGENFILKTGCGYGHSFLCRIFLKVLFALGLYCAGQFFLLLLKLFIYLFEGLGDLLMRKSQLTGGAVPDALEKSLKA